MPRARKPDDQVAARTVQNRAVARARQRALNRLADAHPDEFEALLHVEKHAENVSHIHGADSPETIAWWGPDRGETSPGGARRLASAPNTGPKERRRRST